VMVMGTLSVINHAVSWPSFHCPKGPRTTYTESLISVPPLRRGHESSMRPPGLFGAEPKPPFCRLMDGVLRCLRSTAIIPHPNISTQSEDF
jgi:hypothetical protein